MPYPVYATAFLMTFASVSNTGTPNTNAAPLTKVRQDAGAFAQTTNPPALRDSVLGMWDLTLTAAEMTGDVIAFAHGGYIGTPLVPQPILMTPERYYTQARATEIDTINTGVNSLGGTPAQNQGLINTLQSTLNIQGGTPAQSKTLIQTLQTSVNQQGGTPAQNQILINTIITNQTLNASTILTAVQSQGGTPAQNKGLIQLLQTSVNQQGGTPSQILQVVSPFSSMIVGNVFTAASLVNAPSGGGSSGTPLFLPGDVDALRTGMASLIGNGTQSGNTYQVTQWDGKIATITTSADGNSRTVTVS